MWHKLSFNSRTLWVSLVETQITYQWLCALLMHLQCISNGGTPVLNQAIGISVRLWNLKSLDSLRPSDAYMHQYNRSTLVHIMANRLFGAKPLSEPMLPYCQLDPKEHISVKFHLKSIQVNALENVICKMAAISSQPQCVNNGDTTALH